MHIKHIPRAIKRRVVREMYDDHPEYLGQTVPWWLQRQQWSKLLKILRSNCCCFDCFACKLTTKNGLLNVRVRIRRGSSFAWHVSSFLGSLCGFGEVHNLGGQQVKVSKCSMFLDEMFAPKHGKSKDLCFCLSPILFLSSSHSHFQDNSQAKKSKKDKDKDRASSWKMVMVRFCFGTRSQERRSRSRRRDKEKKERNAWPFRGITTHSKP